MESATAVIAVFLLSCAQTMSEDPPVFLDHGFEAGSPGCVDQDPKCSVWASRGECQSNAVWMMGNCRRSCQSCQGGEQAWKLRTILAGKYDNKSSATNFTIKKVTVQSMRLEHIELEEKSQIMTIHGRVVTSWNDTRLKWDKDQWGVSWLNFYWLQVWTPQLVQTNSPNSVPGKTDSKVLAANYTGQAFMWTDFTFSAPCTLDYANYPSDRQTCCFKIDDKRYYVVRFKVSEAAMIAAQKSAKDTHMSGWKVEKAKISENKYTVKVLSDWSKDPYDLVTTNCDICVTIKRNAGYYSGEIVGPAIATAVVTLSSFLVGSFWNQILLLLSSMALQFISLFTVNSRLPPSTGKSPRILCFYSINLIVTLILLICSCIFLNLASLKNTMPPPHLFDKMLELIKKLLPWLKIDTDETKFGDPIAESDQNPAAEPCGRCHWAPVTKVFKYGLFLFCLVLYLFLILGCLAA